jgi:hypothetical protein
MSALTPGQRLHPASPNGYGPPVTVESVGDIGATLTHNGRCVFVNTDSDTGDHVADWSARDGWQHFHTDARREMLSKRYDRQRAMMRIGLVLGDADLDTLNAVLGVLGEEPVVGWRAE